MGWPAGNLLAVAAPAAFPSLLPLARTPECVVTADPFPVCVPQRWLAPELMRGQRATPASGKGDGGRS